MQRQRFNLLDRIIRDLRLKEIKPYLTAGSVICDLGCGDGSVLRHLSTKIQYGYGIDKKISDQKEGNLSFIRGDITKPLPFDDGIFDSIISLAVLEHLEFPDFVFQEARRKLKEGGIFILTTPAPLSKILLEFLAFKLKIISSEEIKEHKHYYSKQELCTLLEKHGFNVLKLKSFCLGFNIMAIGQK